MFGDYRLADFAFSFAEEPSAAAGSSMSDSR